MPDEEKSNNPVDLFQANVTTLWKSSVDAYSAVWADALRMATGQSPMTQEAVTKNATKFWGQMASDAIAAQTMFQSLVDLAADTEVPPAAKDTETEDDGT